MVNIIVDDEIGHNQTECSVNGMRDGNESPGKLESLLFLFRLRDAVAAFSPPRCCSLGLLCGGQFDEISYKEMTRYECRENRGEEDVVFAVVVAFDTDQDSILLLNQRLMLFFSYLIVSVAYFHEIFHHQSEIHHNCRRSQSID